MRRTRAELEAVAKGIVNGTVADIMCEFPTIEKAIIGMRGKNAREWAEFLDRKACELTEILVTKFDTID